MLNWKHIASPHLTQQHSRLCVYVYVCLLIRKVEKNVLPQLLLGGEKNK